MSVLQENLGVIIAAGVVIAAWFLLRNRATPLETAESIDAMSGGQPMVLDFFANI